jgi:hypothetical protein
MLLGQSRCIRFVVTHEEESDLAFRNIGVEFGPNPDSKRPVQRRERFIEQQEPGVAKKGPPQRHPLLLPT